MKTRMDKRIAAAVNTRQAIEVTRAFSGRAGIRVRCAGVTSRVMRMRVRPVPIGGRHRLPFG